MPSTEWYYDASSSRLLRYGSHLPVVAIGGGFLLALLFVVWFIVTNPHFLFSPQALLVALFVLIGGPFSLLYLWPMVADSEQRPSVAEFEGGSGFPFTYRSISGAAILGAIGLFGTSQLGVPFEVVYWIAVGFVFSPLLVAIVTTHGELSTDGLTINQTDVPLERVTDIRTIWQIRLVILWISYAPRSGVFLPRLVTVPSSQADAVRETLERGIEASSERDPPNRAVQVVLFLFGMLVLAVAGLAYTSLTDMVAQRYVVVVFGGLGLVLCFVGWRGL